jgi:hypothetical protein
MGNASGALRPDFSTGVHVSMGIHRLSKGEIA